MKRVITIGCLLLALLFSANQAAYAQLEDEDVNVNEEQITVGAGLVYGSEIESLGIKADAYYSLNPMLRVGGGLTYFFPEDIVGGGEINWFALNLNGHYFLYSQEKLSVYGLTGLNILFQNTNFDSEQVEDISDSEIGLNLGGGLEYNLNFADFFGELKVGGLFGDADQLVLGAGLRFNL